MMKQKARKPLADAPLEQCFWVNHGPVLKNLRDLERALKSSEISEEQFRYHVAKGKNDFSLWIKDVLDDETCARALARVKTRKTALRIISEHLKHLR